MKELDSTRGIANYTAMDLDDLINFWRYKRENFKLVEEEEFVNAIGAAFGSCLNKAYNSVCKIISDEYGTDFSCVSEKPEFQTFPFSSVWKAIE